MNNKEAFEARAKAQDEVLAYWNEPKKEQQNMIKALEDNSAVFAASIHRISSATGHTYKEVSDVASLFAKQGMSFHKVLELTESTLHCIAATPTLANMDQIKKDVEAFNALKERANGNVSKPVFRMGLSFGQLHKLLTCK